MVIILQGTLSFSVVVPVAIYIVPCESIHPSGSCPMRNCPSGNCLDMDYSKHPAGVNDIFAMPSNCDETLCQ